MAEQIIPKSNAKLKFLYRQTRNINQKAKQLLTSALIQSHFDYASSSWCSGLTKKYKSRLQCTQNKIIRFLLNAPARTHIGSIEFRRVNMLHVELRGKQLKLNLVNGKAPNYLPDALNLKRSQHNINTVSSYLFLHVPCVKSFGKNFFLLHKYTGMERIAI